MSSLNTEPATIHERVQVLEAEIIVVRHDIANIKTMLEFIMENIK